MQNNLIVYPAIFGYADDGISVSFPDLPGCFSCGRTDAEALLMAKDALRCYLAMLQDGGEPIPQPTSLHQIRTGGHDRITLVCIGDAQPVRHEEWVFNKVKNTFYCSGCKERALHDGVLNGPDCIAQALSGWCPHCGAKMDGGTGNG